MKLLYICKDFTSMNDGGQIYDSKFFNSLKENLISVDYFFVKVKKNISLPFWKHKIEDEEINNIKKIIKEYDKIIISHETLLDLAKEVKPDLFIIHNLFSIFKSPNIFLNIIYRLMAKKAEKSILNYSKNILVLSYREKIHLQNTYKKINIIVEPPGLKSIKKPSKIDLNVLKITGSKEWLPKKLSSLKEHEILKLKKNFILCDKELVESNCSLIEENFLAGFKLKLLEMIYNGDLIFSKVDLKNEIKNLGLRDDLFFLIKDIKEISDFDTNFDIKLLKEVREKNQKILFEQYQWIQITKRIMEKI